MKTVRIESDGLPGSHGGTRVIDVATGTVIPGTYAFEVTHKVKSGAAARIYCRLPALSLYAGAEMCCTIPDHLIDYTFIAGGKRFRLVEESGRSLEPLSIDPADLSMDWPEPKTEIADRWLDDGGKPPASEQEDE